MRVILCSHGYKLCFVFWQNSRVLIGVWHLGTEFIRQTKLDKLSHLKGFVNNITLNVIRSDALTVTSFLCVCVCFVCACDAKHTQGMHYCPRNNDRRFYWGVRGPPILYWFNMFGQNCLRNIPASLPVLLWSVSTACSATLVTQTLFPLKSFWT